MNTYPVLAGGVGGTKVDPNVHDVGVVATPSQVKFIVTVPATGPAVNVPVPALV